MISSCEGSRAFVLIVTIISSSRNRSISSIYRTRAACVVFSRLLTVTMQSQWWWGLSCLPCFSVGFHQHWPMTSWRSIRNTISRCSPKRSPRRLPRSNHKTDTCETAPVFLNRWHCWWTSKMMEQPPFRSCKVSDERLSTPLHKWRDLGNQIVYLDNGFCKYGQLFDPSTGRCRDIYCQELNYMFNGTTCIPDTSKNVSEVYKRMSDIDLLLPLTISPSSHHERGNFSKHLNSRMNHTCAANWTGVFHDTLSGQFIEETCDFDRCLSLSLF